MELLDIVDAGGNPTGQTVERDIAHAEGIPHRTSHVWLFRRRGEQKELLLQLRCAQKSSFPGCYDISSAGHIPAGSDFRESAIRELWEEIGVEANEDNLIFCGDRHVVWDDVFGGKPYHDRQYTRVFALDFDREEAFFRLQPEEVGAVRWMELEEVISSVERGTIPNCISLEELGMVRRAISTL